MFVDEVNILVNAGDGGDGCMAFRREKFVPMGGPYGGSGGKGGDVIFRADSGLKTLIDLKYQKHIKGLNGLNGEGKNKNGKSADDIIVKVPIGTTIKDNNTGLVLADLKKNGEEVIVAYGGRGGRGNVSLSTKSNPCPSFCERGEPGEVRSINATLRMIADVGLVGLPSVGKSTILSQISAANPKIASYHFTTLSPNLGVVKTKNEKTFVVADLPGLIEGASNGLGLGHKFLKHVERTKIIAHVIDISGSEGRDPYEDYLVINKELQEFNPKLLEKPRIIIANKMDLPNAKENLDKLREEIGDIKIFEIEAISNKGLEEVINYLGEMTSEIEEQELFEDNNYETHVLYKFKEELPFTITKVKDVWVIKGDKVERLLKMTNFNGEEAYVQFAKKLRHMGIDDELERLGVQEGDVVRILDYEFEYTK
ncbi:gTPase obg [Clostridium sp. CAG:762]|nr:gTPase obg [Clostridium sp. CAG:762]